MGATEGDELYTLYVRAKALEGDEREAFLAELRRSGAREAAQEIAELIAEDEAGVRFSLGLGGSVGAAMQDLLSGERTPESYLEEIEKYAPGTARYDLGEEVARGAMGSIRRVVDKPLRRELAMKVALRMHGGDDGVMGSLGRFVEEAQITGQLDHPGIVPVHELGVDPDGRPYFTMRLVRGRELAEIFELVHEGAEGWSTTRVLGLLLKVCEAMAYAHSKGVIHRDLKPANVMVGRFGEVYVMDWGLAKVVGQPDRRDLRWKKPVETRPVGSDVRDGTGIATPSTPLMTMDGAVVGTPAYMPPEQGSGQAELLDERADVYAVGSMLYELLVGRPPYVPAEGNITPHTLLASLIQGPPQSLRELAPEAPLELVAICEKAMSRSRTDRYASLHGLARDLSAFLEGRVVQAYESGAWAEARKWILRNKAVAATLAAAVVLVFSSLLGIVSVQASAKEGIAREADRARLAKQEAEQRTEDVLMLSAFQQLSSLERTADELWPPEPRHLSAYRDWVAAAASLKGRLEPLRRNVAAIRTELEFAPDESGIADSNFDAEGVPFGWLLDELVALVEQIEGLTDPHDGLASERGISPRHGWSIPQRLAMAERLEHGLAPGGEFASRWAETVDALRTDERFTDTRIAPLPSLVPIGRDPDSELWEFWHVPSGSEPSRNESGRIVPEGDDGLVFVLLPGGTFVMGSQSEDPDGTNYDPSSSSRLESVRKERVPACFVSKYEMTQGQWLRITGLRPSNMKTDRFLVPDAPGLELLVNPVEGLSWNDAIAGLERMGLELPTDELWEYAARGGTTTAWFTGNDKLDLSAAANLADRSAPPTGQRDLDLHDGFRFHAPVGSLLPNPFGLHDVHGNVREWCRDQLGSTARVRGGSWQTDTQAARSAFVSTEPRRHSFMDLGVRPVIRVPRPQDGTASTR